MRPMLSSKYLRDEDHEIPEKNSIFGENQFWFNELSMKASHTLSL